MWRSPRTSSNAVTPATIGLAIGGAATAVAVYFFVELVHEHGFEGALYYIWEGDPYPPHIRSYMHELDESSTKLGQQRDMIDALQSALDRARSFTFQSANQHVPTLTEAWTKCFKHELATKGVSASGINLNTIDLKKVLGGISYILDQIAASIDSIPASVDPIVKQRKKDLSTQIVALMERADTLISTYKNETSEQNNT